MRICLVSFEYPPFHGGGIGTYAGIISRCLARAGHEVHVLANGWDGAGDGDSAAPVGGLTIHRLRALDAAFRPLPPHDRPGDPLGTVCLRFERALYWSVLVAEALAELWRRDRVEVVEFPECFAEGYTALRRRAAGLDLHRLAMCVHLHTPIEDHTELNLGRVFEPWYRRRVAMERYGIVHADRLSSPSRSLAAIVRGRLGLDTDRHPCDVIPYAVDQERHAPAEEQSVGAADPPTLLFVGRLEPRKGVVELVDAAVRVMADSPALTVRLLGRDCDAGVVRGSMVEFLKGRIPAEHRERFLFEGQRPREEVLAAYRSATACVFPAPWDNFPFTCCEAMASGSCVVVGAEGGMAELVQHERSGLVAPVRDVGALAAAIRRVLADPVLARTLRRGAIRRVREVCDPRRVVAERVEHYQAAIDTRRHHPRIGPVTERAR
mgnify:CR=1 FL=1